MRIFVLPLLLLVAACSDDTRPPAHDAAADGPTSTDAPRREGPAAERATPPELGTDAGTKVDRGPVKDSGWSITCGSQVGSASVTGSVQGKTPQVSHAGGARMIISAMPGLEAYTVALFDLGGTCTQVAQNLKSPAVVITLCSKTPGTYQVNKSCLPDGGAGISVQNDVELPNPSGPDLEASSGTITLESLDPSCGGKVKGSFAVKFGTDSLEGSFDTVGCGDIKL
jgi:hypothetical protein